MGHAGNEEDVQIPADLAGDIQDVVVDYQVSSGPKRLRRSILVKTAGTDRATASDIRSESRTDCESLELIFANVPDR